MIDRIALLLLIIGGINWGLVGISFRRRCSDTKQDHLRFGSYFGYLVHFTVFQRQQTCHRAVVPCRSWRQERELVSEGSILSRVCLLHILKSALFPAVMTLFFLL